MRNGTTHIGALAAAAPATVSGERSAIRHWDTGKAAQGAMTRKPGDQPCVPWEPAVGDDGQGDTDMTTQTLSRSALRSDILALAAVGLIGLGIVFVAGHAQAGALHDAAHDVRHATGFPCH